MTAKKGICRDTVLDILRLYRGKPLAVFKLIELSGFNYNQVMEALESLKAEGLINYNSNEKVEEKKEQA